MVPRPRWDASGRWEGVPRDLLPVLFRATRYDLADRYTKAFEGFEHASILTDLDGDGKDELYVASDKHKEVRRYVWDGNKLVREVIYVRPDKRAIFTWNLMPVPLELVP